MDILFYGTMSLFLIILIAFFIGFYTTRKSQINFYNYHEPQYQFKAGSSAWWGVPIIISLLCFSVVIVVISWADLMGGDIRFWLGLFALITLGCIFFYCAVTNMYHKLYFDNDMITYKNFLANTVHFSNKQIISYQCFKRPFIGRKKPDNISITWLVEEKSQHTLSFYLPFKKRILFYEWCLHYCPHATDETPIGWGDFPQNEIFTWPSKKK